MSAEPDRTVLTVGHGVRSVGDLVGVLRDGDVDLLVDVRRHPASRRNPQHARSSLEVALPRQDIGYAWWGDPLGGRRSGAVASRHVALGDRAFRAYADWMDGTEFRGALARLEQVASRRRVAIMCAETRWEGCHRRYVADALALRGARVIHLVGVGQHESHDLHPAVRRDGAGWPVYDRDQAPTLF